MTETEAVHTVPMSTAVCRLAAPWVDAQDGGDTARTAPPVVRLAAQRREGGGYCRTELLLDGWTDG